MTLGEERFAGWVDVEPSQALRFLGLASSSVLLMSPLHPDIRRLRENAEYRWSTSDWFAAGYVPVAVSGTAVGGTAVGRTAADDPDAEVPDEAGDVGSLDLDAFSLDPDVSSGLEGASAAIDSGTNSGGGGFWAGGAPGEGGSGWGGDGGGGWGGNGGGFGGEGGGF